MPMTIGEPGGALSPLSKVYAFRIAATAAITAGLYAYGIRGR